MRERAVIDGIDRHLPKTVYRQSMTGASIYAGGTPDRYYDGPAADLWAEYKRLEHLPRSKTVVGDYSEKQLAWMTRRYNNSLNLPHGPNVIGVVGLPNRTAVIQRTPTEWREGTPLAQARPFKEIACEISGLLLHGHWGR